jgi:hypothetical protein
LQLIAPGTNWTGCGDKRRQIVEELQKTLGLATKPGESFFHEEHENADWNFVLGAYDILASVRAVLESRRHPWRQLRSRRWQPGAIHFAGVAWLAFFRPSPSVTNIKVRVASVAADCR